MTVTKEACEQLGRELYRKLAFTDNIADSSMWQRLNEASSQGLGGMVPGRAATYGGAGALAGGGIGALLTLLKKDPKATDYLLNAAMGAGVGGLGGAGLGVVTAMSDRSGLNQQAGALKGMAEPEGKAFVEDTQNYDKYRAYIKALGMREGAMDDFADAAAKNYATIEDIRSLQNADHGTQSK